jgi:glycosyltransferase involved in cell wall biosynthesis
MNNKSTLIILSPGFPKDEQDTTCLPAQQVFVKALNKNFPSLNIIILAFQYPFASKKYRWFENDIIALNGNNKKKFLRLLLWFRVSRTLQKLKKQNNIIGVLSFWCTECALVGKYFANKNNLIHINWILGQDAKKNPYIKWIKPSSDELVALSDFVSDTFLKNHKIKPAYTIPLGIDANMFGKDALEKNIDILGAGSLIPLKQYDVFIEVVAEIQKSVSEINVVLCGGGPEEKKLREIICHYRLEKNISLKGNTEHKQVLHLMQKTKIFLHTSSYEGFGIVCLEALYASAHVISFVKPMNRSIQNWHIVFSKEEMIKKALQLLNDSPTSYTRVLPYSVDDSAKAIMKLFPPIQKT